MHSIYSYLSFDNSFNRYMVECEFLPLKFIGKPILVLIDTWWNVNDSCARINRRFSGF